MRILLLEHKQSARAFSCARKQCHCVRCKACGIGHVGSLAVDQAHSQHGLYLYTCWSMLHSWLLSCCSAAHVGDGGYPGSAAVPHTPTVAAQPAARCSSSRSRRCSGRCSSSWCCWSGWRPARSQAKGLEFGSAGTKVGWASKLLASFSFCFVCSFCSFSVLSRVLDADLWLVASWELAKGLEFGQAGTQVGPWPVHKTGYHVPLFLCFLSFLVEKKTPCDLRNHHHVVLGEV